LWTAALAASRTQRWHRHLAVETYQWEHTARVPDSSKAWLLTWCSWTRASISWSNLDRGSSRLGLPQLTAASISCWLNHGFSRMALAGLNASHTYMPRVLQELLRSLLLGVDPLPRKGRVSSCSAWARWRVSVLLPVQSLRLGQQLDGAVQHLELGLDEAARHAGRHTSHAMTS
jgi:hypothetical protein